MDARDPVISSLDAWQYYHIYARFHCNITRVILITGYVAEITFSYSRFLCNERRVSFITGYVAVITFSYSRFHCNERLVIFITGCMAVITMHIFPPPLQ